MTRSEFKNILKEEIRDILREDLASKLYRVEGLLVTDNDKKTQSQVLSDIRSIAGITTVDNEEYTPNAPKEGRSYNRLTIKIDPYPYTKSGGTFTIDNIKQIIFDVGKIKGVVKFVVENPQMINIGI